MNVPLTPHLQKFVRDQLASGHFQSEADVIRAALELLEDQSRSTASLPQYPSVDSEITHRSSGPARQERWAGPRDRRHRRDDEAPKSLSVRRSPRGILADIRSDISSDDIEEARREMWTSFPHSEA